MSCTDNAEKKVRFGELTIAEYAVVIGDHPCVSSGLPIQLGWEVQKETVENVNMYEYFRACAPRRPRTLSKEKRQELLAMWGVTHEDIRNCRNELSVCRSRRRDSLREIGFDDDRVGWVTIYVSSEMLGKALKSAGRRVVLRKRSFQKFFSAAIGRSNSNSSRNRRTQPIEPSVHHDHHHGVAQPVI